MTGSRVHAFGDDALGEHDAVALAELVAAGAVSPQELADAAIARALSVDPRLNAAAYTSYASPRFSEGSGGALYGVPTYVKDNTDVRGMPTNHGTDAYVARPKAADGAYARQYLSTGMTVLGKTRLPEFGFSASTEFMTHEPDPQSVAHRLLGRARHRAAPRRSSPRASSRSRMPTTAVARSGSLPPVRDSSDSSRAGIATSMPSRHATCRSTWSPKAS